MKRYVLIAGVNGAGKSTLFSLIPALDGLYKINLDEIVREIGDWRNTRDVIKAGKLVVTRIEDYFAAGLSFSQETTLCGHSILNNIDKAKALGYCIELHYVGLSSADLAKQRIKNRLAHGGHGVSDEDVERRYLETLRNLKQVLPLCDTAVIYDNTEIFRRFAVYEAGKLMWHADNIPQWFSDNVCD